MTEWPEGIAAVIVQDSAGVRRFAEILEQTQRETRDVCRCNKGTVFGSGIASEARSMNACRVLVDSSCFGHQFLCKSALYRKVCTEGPVVEPQSPLEHRLCARRTDQLKLRSVIP